MNNLFKFLALTVFLFILSINVINVFAQRNSAKEWTDKSPHTQGFVSANGVKLHYLDWGGKGDTVVFLTGMGVSSHIFDDLAPKFKDRFRVLSYTRRGLYKSDKPESGYDTATLTEDLRGFLDALKIQRATLVGWSLAGTEMTRFAALYPERVKSLVYLESAYDYSNLAGLWARDPIVVDPSEADMSSWESSKVWFKKVYGLWSDAVEADGRAVNLQADGTVKLQVMPPEISEQLFKGMVEAKPDFSKIKAPVLAFYAMSESHPFISSAKDAETRKKGNDYWKNEFIPTQKSEIGKLKKDLPSAKIVILKESQHLCFIKSQDEAKIVREMNRFLSGR